MMINEHASNEEAREAQVARLKAALEQYAENRRQVVGAGGETAELAALLVEKYGYGMAIAAEVLGANCASSPLLREVDAVVLTIDPDAIRNRESRWKARPARLALD
jgi:hypothetical protein